MDKNLFSNRLADLRKTRGFKTQYALAKAYYEKFPPKRRDDTSGSEGDFSGILVTIKNYENPNKSLSPKLSIVCNLCEILDCDIDYLLGNIDVPRHITQDMMDLTGLSEGACEKLKYLLYEYLRDINKHTYHKTMPLELMKLLLQLMS